MKRSQFLEAVAAKNTERDKKRVFLAEKAAANKKSLLLISTGISKKHLRAWVQQHFDASLQAPKTILFIPYALDKSEWSSYESKIRAIFEKLGIDIISGLDFDDAAKLLNRVDGVFVFGGNTFRLLDTLQRTGLLWALRKKVNAGLPYMGASAGAIIACPTIKTTNDMPIIQPQSLEAMGLVKFQINAHYVNGAFYSANEKTGEILPDDGETRNERITEFLEANDVPVVGLRTGSALHIKGDMITLLGGKPAKMFRKRMEAVEVNDGKTLADLLNSDRDFTVQEVMSRRKITPR